MNQPGGERAASFINRLQALGDDRPGRSEAGHHAALAELRRGLGRTPGAAPGAYRQVLALFDGRSASRQFEDVCFQVATLYALYPHNNGTPRPGDTGNPAAGDAGRRAHNLGHSLARFAQKEGRKQGAERRMIALLNCNEDDLPVHLRHIVSLLRSDDKPIDWRQLLRDLRRWGDDDRRVQRAWAQAFWGFGSDLTTDSSAASGPTAATKENE